MRSPARKIEPGATSTMSLPMRFMIVYLSPSAGPDAGAGALEGRWSAVCSTAKTTGALVCSGGAEGLGVVVCGGGAGGVGRAVAVSVAAALGVAFLAGAV